MVQRAQYETAGDRKSPAISGPSVLVKMTDKRIREFIGDTANLPNPLDYSDHAPQFGRWYARWGGLFTYRAEVKGARKSVYEERVVPVEDCGYFAAITRTSLNRMWSERGVSQYEWYCYRLRDAHRQMIRHLEGWGEVVKWGGPKTPARFTDYDLTDAPPPSPFEAVALWLQKNRSSLMVCASPTCPAPYALRSEKAQKHCSPECADVARKAAKLRWWNESPNSPKNRR